jgi:hypothetical protein
MLVNHADATPKRRIWRSQAQRLAVQQNLSGIWLV